MPLSRQKDHSAVQAQYTVMVIDNDPLIREWYRDLLEAENFVVIEAGNGAEALIWFLRHTANLIVLDLRMPVLDGRSFLEYRPRMAKIRHIPILVVSSWLDDPDLRQVLPRLGADRLLRKPVRREDLLGAVRETLERPHPPSAPSREAGRETGARRDARVAFSAPIRILTHSAVVTSGRLHDLSAGGLGADLPDRLSPGESITVSFDMEGGFVAVAGFVQWVEEGRTAMGYRHGIRFAERQEETFALYAYSFFRDRPGNPSWKATF